MSSATSHRLFVQSGLGLEALVADELTELGFEVRPLEGGVETRGQPSALYRICLASRLAESVRVRLKDFRAREFAQLAAELKKLPFRAFLAEGAAVRVKVVCQKSKLWHSGAVQERCESVLADHVKWRVSNDEDAHVLHVRLDDNQVQVSLEASGRLHRRGYRQHVEKASLRETLAAATVRASAGEILGKEGETVLWDPFCGAATIALEALGWAHGKLPGADRTHAFEAWRNFDERTLDELKSSEADRSRAAAPLPQLRAICSDINERALESSRRNTEAAELLGHCTFHHGDVEDVAPQIPRGAWVVTNPPYGKRIQEAGAVKKLLKVLEARPDLRPAVALVGGAAREAIPKDRPALFRTKNGGVPVSARRLS